MLISYKYYFFTCLTFAAAHTEAAKKQYLYEINFKFLNLGGLNCDSCLDRSSFFFGECVFF